ncbi:hypothetical protein ACLB2K_056638 [Fragaria x ananassa]
MKYEREGFWFAFSWWSTAASKRKEGRRTVGERKKKKKKKEAGVKKERDTCHVVSGGSHVPGGAAVAPKNFSLGIMFWLRHEGIVGRWMVQVAESQGVWRR